MSTEISPPNLDLELVERCTRGDRDAFATLVSRYQSLVCAQAYSICGDFTRSEDVAQDTFVSAWRQLPQLREPAKFKAWLCGIARHLALRVAEARNRERGASVEHPSNENSPHDVVASREEEALVWQSLEELPDSYRTALILYYREQQSISAVAESLEISEEATRQRLARGRAMLRQQVASVVETTLSRTRPGPAFTLAVLGALPLALPATASAGTLVAATKSGAAGGAMGLPILGASAGVLAGVLGGWLGVKASAEATRYERERQYVFRTAWRMSFVIVGFLAVQLFGIWYLVRSGGKVGPAGVFLIVGAVLAYVGWLVWDITRTNRTLRQIRAEEQAAGAPEREAKGIWKTISMPVESEYRSRFSFLGLPLLHVRWTMSDAPLWKKPCAKGWIAIGDRAIGALAFGTASFGIVSFGAFGAGLLAFGGLAFGLISFGGLAFGMFVSAGLAIGWEAHGGMALALHIAYGGVATARDFAIGGIANAAQANNDLAAAAVAASQWLRLTSMRWFSSMAPVVLGAMFVVVAMVSSRMQRRSRSGAEGVEPQAPTDPRDS